MTATHFSLLLATALLVLNPTTVTAVVAGAAPDTPAARVDPNVASSPFSGVVSIETADSIFSGALIARRFVLTAGHIFDGNPAPSTVFINFNLSAGPPIRIVAASYVKHPNYVSFGNPNINNDLAIVELESDAPLQAAIYPLAVSVPLTGLVATLVGYGDTGTGDVGITIGRSATVKRTGRNALDAFIVDDPGSGQPEVFYCDFDGATAATNYVGSLTLGNAIEATVGGGDSGAPMLIQDGGQWKLIGVATFVSSFTGGPATRGVFGTAMGGQWTPSYATWVTGVSSAGADQSSEVPELGAIGRTGAIAALGLLLFTRVRRRAHCLPR